ncbi:MULTISPECIES: alpha/beta fold hydrolase [Streptomyces]|uniref:Alpha/beta hydrolase n=1 Tax=Streptomyces xinghaiensis TaxID=1038928 RepID=A0A3R7I657_9ACTN|nr:MULTISPECIES: alpha/beta hydrolase [Streptomyces]PQM23213.1 alpha/beta hydrolase [Streptomyces xinghaiensis]RKM94774.1 alpha/beta hydrolase [Streptomyces xinghaiensis]RNC74785.1 alpha/beta hydrolase [Streptomyces xinghaiensis]
MSQLLSLAMPSNARTRSLVTSRGDFAVVDMASDSSTHPVGTVVMVPGFMGSKEDFLPMLLPLGRAGYRAVAIDGRGQHETGGFHPPTAYAREELARDLVAVVDALDAGPVHLLGHSYGALLARVAVLQTQGDTSLWRSMTLMNFGPAQVSELQRDRLNLLISVLDTMTLEDIWPYLDIQDTAPSDDVRDFMRSRWVANDPNHVKAAAEHLLTELDSTATLATLKLPKAIVSGSPDLTWDPDGVTSMAQSLSAKLVTMPGGGHSPNIHCPEETTAALVAFWETISTY